MGWAMSWVAVSGKTPQDVLDVLELVHTGKREEFPDADYTCVALPESAWFVVAANRDGVRRLADRVKALSAGCTVIACEVEEHVMFSSVACWSQGERRWRVEHVGEEGDIYNLSATGDLPPEFIGIHARQKKAQDDDGGEKSEVDHLFEVPPMLAKALTSFRHDEDIEGADAEPFEVLRPNGGAGTSRSWWKFW